jgi:hypothetical protein
MQQQATKLPTGVYKLPSGRYQAKYAQTHLGVFDTLKEAELEVLSAKEGKPKPKSSVPVFIEYAIWQSSQSKSYYVKLRLLNKETGNRKTTHIGSYKDLRIARIARNNALRKYGITPPPKHGIDLSIIEQMPELPFDKRRTFDAQNTKEAKARKERKKPTAKSQIVIAVEKSYIPKPKKSTLPPTLTFNPPPELPDLTGVVHEVGVFKINGVWVAFVNYKPFPATSPEDGQRIIERGGKLKLKGEK